jgi:hypothetical protein
MQYYKYTYRNVKNLKYVFKSIIIKHSGFSSFMGVWGSISMKV